MFPRRYVLLCSAAYTILFTASVFAQTAPAAPSPKPSEILHGALAQVSQTLDSLNISRWKAPGEVRSAAQQNADSIQRDLNSTLPGLLTQADAAPGSVAAVFPAYRNVDALYDVLLRVSQTASITAPQNEAADLASALDKLEAARTRLADSILANSKNTETQLVNLQTAVRKAEASQSATPPKTVIVDNSPAKTSTRRKKKTTNPPNSSNTSTPSSPQ
jgi:hypothetical protein